MHRSSIRAGACGAILVALLVDAAPATRWPAAPVRVIVAFAAGGANDLLARSYSEALSEAFGQQFFVENRTGGAGLVGTQAVARAAPDGHVLLGSGMASLVVSPAMSAAPGFDPLADFSHIAFLGGTPHVLVVHPRLEVRSFSDLVVTAKRERGGLQYLSASLGSPGNLVGELLSQKLQLNLVHVAYRGAGQAVSDLIGGHVKVGLISYSTARRHIGSGALLALAVSSDRRLQAMPDVPTFKELGIPELATTSWYALSGPANLPGEIVSQLNDEVSKAISSPLVRGIISQEAIQVTAMSPADVTGFIKGELEKWTPLARRLAVERR
jgi:tripartite-type tricarboxylate transporter receptor subunit TctC